ncbi:MAG: NmrA family protein, partial [Oxalobacteraceae bacterium]|nr:NmrA family protein [Oxalobacteraceae bacterium]
MSIILFGATGDLGSRVAKHLHHLGAEVRCVVRKGSTARAQALLQS